MNCPEKKTSLREGEGPHDKGPGRHRREKGEDTVKKPKTKMSDFSRARKRINTQKKWKRGGIH